ncbi:Soluble aldose sugar dehydrogenase YliI precursor [Planctomycetes bacterium Poly30]|uniref:Soluble aldose sugar dehydrogenase YliI n=1 Tax=Saltatorellus ferox TaxID=2528018 RepID=A0A518EST7_9BACT|nr:Soluble aldose sugar dehydrogenase YliI precursor [Planctomycetes bacterium Poly30]
MHRSTLLAGLAATLLAWTAAPAAGQAPLTTELFVNGLVSPTDLTFAPGDPTRVFIVEQRGTIQVVENGVTAGAPFLDIRSMVGSGGERGLLGLAFHPDYQTNGRFFVNFTNTGGNTRITEFAVTADPNVADPTVVQFIDSINQDFSNHNGGCLRFGPDGKLYVGMGDGGSGNDPNGRAQDGMQLLGKMLRYDVDIPSPFIPADNPFVGVSTVRDEIWHIGVRNPWRFTFDRMTGDLWIADVGQNAREEVDFIPAGVGGLNLGWRCKEGTRCTGLSGCVCTDTTLIDPIIEYTHGQGCSITGGMIYRGSAIPSLQGTYFYADYCSNRIWSLRYDGTNVLDFMERQTELDPPGSASLSNITAFGEDFDGEIYILSGARAWKIVEDVPPCGYTNFCQAVAGSTGTPAIIAGTGSTSIGANDFGLAAGGVPSNGIGIFFYGPEQTSTTSGLGNLCVAGNASKPLIRIYPAVQADILGSAFLQVDFTAPNQSMGPGAINAGDTLNFQFWFRDNQGGTPSWNFTNGLSAVFCP